MPERGRPDLRFGILGPLTVEVGGSPVPVSSHRQRALLVLLLMNVGSVVPTDRLIEQLWDGAPPPQAGVTLRSYVSNLRHALGGGTGQGAVLATRGRGYALDVPPAAIDAVRMRELTEAGHDHLRRGRPADAVTAFTAATRLWRGDPLADVADHEAARATVTALTETYLGAMEGRFEALLRTGRHVDALPGLEEFCAEHPLREGPRALQMLGLHRSGRAADALEVYRRFRTLLRDELGLEPSARLQHLQRQILDGDPALDAPDIPVDDEPEATPAAPLPAADRAVVGRRDETALLRSHLDRLRTQRRGALVLLPGEPGIGKTTMLDAVAELAHGLGVAVHLGRSPAPTGVPPFWPWTQVLESIASGLDGDSARAATAGQARPVVQLSPTLAEHAGAAAPQVAENAQAMRFLLYEAVSTFLRRACPSPTVLLLDDLHWADLPSLELLSYLTPTLGERALLVVAAFRDLPADRSAGLDATLATVAREDVVHELRLPGLDRRGVAELLAEVSPASPPDHRLVSLLHERTGGNPFFVRQLARLLLERPRHPHPPQDPAAQAIPSGVRHVIADRLRGLAPGTIAFLEAAAVVGRDFDLAVAAAAASVAAGAALDAVDEAAAHGLVERTVERTGTGTHRFVHALVQEVVVDALPAGRAARLHAAVAAQLDASGAGVDEIAEHMWQARDLLGAAAVRPQLEAAERAAAVYAYERAEQHMRRALDLVRRTTPPDPQAELSVVLRLFRLIATERGWGSGDARELVSRARELAAAGAVHAETVRLWWSLWLFLLDRDDHASADEVAGTFEAVTAGLDDRAAVVAGHLMGFFRQLTAGRSSTAREHLRAARAAADAADDSELAAFDEHLDVMLLLTEGHVAALDGDAATHRSCVDAAVALADADGRPFPRAIARTLGAVSAVYVAAPEYSRELATQAVAVDRRFGFGWLTTVAECAAAAAGAVTGDEDPQAAGEQLAQVAEWLADVGRAANVATVLTMLGLVQHAAGDAVRARETLALARRQPGPYRGLMVAYLDRRLAALEPGATRAPRIPKAP